MKSATWEKKVTELFLESGSDAVMIFTEDYETGKVTRDYFPIAPWADGNEIVKAGNKIFRITF